MSKKEKANTAHGRYNTSEDTKRIVWIRSAGHCELCGVDLTYDYRVGRPMKWGEVAHILPASPKGPRGSEEHDEIKAQALTNDSDNLMLLCPGCHDRIDRDAERYQEQDLTGLHQAFLERIRLAATTPDAGRAVPVIVQGQHFSTKNDIAARDLLMAMSAEGLTAFDHEVKIILPAPSSRGRDALYWQNIKDSIQHDLEGQLRRRGGCYGDVPALAVVGVADIPALMLLGQAIGDRSNRLLFSFNRETQLGWPDQTAEPPAFQFTPPPDGEGPIALVLSISAQIPHRDVLAALPEARIAEFTIPEPSYMMVHNRRIIHAFRNELQKYLSQLEALTPDAIHVFPAIPAALAIEFGALLTTQHQHSYLVFDRDKSDQFKSTLSIGPHGQETQPCS
ncbi:HNH endonuclease [Serratia entomophila]|uniref:HNH endonuclease n=1 Tax=Serratia entomophila TaxID=42906 RepID=UPI00217984A9|nr:SAVED domain-containing protein [Serratia entomophila]CAI0822658.1 Uncharacterised protein [Serratia entomophila]CAI1540475.1 Uncharacterised protein [Serratia entomophila]CAI1549407.1 Uncharacterised protein [Serratia entomophila]CAI1635872.1 Uncharacterised protein [Serratia entomophila]CAI1662467.1 Uncharacterised protein [Serratia entomophila]